MHLLNLVSEIKIIKILNKINGTTHVYIWKKKKKIPTFLHQPYG